MIEVVKSRYPDIELEELYPHFPRMVMPDDPALSGYAWEDCHHEIGIVLLGYFGCQGAPSPAIERFIHRTIVTDEDEWEVYADEARKHPYEDALRKAKEFVQKVICDHG